MKEPNYQMMFDSAVQAKKYAFDQYRKAIIKEWQFVGVGEDGSMWYLDGWTERQAKLDELRKAFERASIKVEHWRMAKGEVRMMTDQELNIWERQDNVLKVLTSKEFGAWLYRRDKNKQKMGKWIDMDTPTSRYIPRYKCSICGNWANHSNFCPNCGADMRGEEDDRYRTKKN